MTIHDHDPEVLREAENYFPAAQCRCGLALWCHWTGVVPPLSCNAYYVLGERPVEVLLKYDELIVQKVKRKLMGRAEKAINP